MVTPSKVTTDNFQETIKAPVKPVLLKFGAPWCAPCKAFQPTVEKLANVHSDLMDTYEVDIDQSPEVAARCQIMSVPTLVMFYKGKEVFRQSGALGYAGLSLKVKDALDGIWRG